MELNKQIFIYFGTQVDQALNWLLWKVKVADITHIVNQVLIGL